MDMSTPLSKGERIGCSVGCVVLLVAAAGGLYIGVQNVREASDRSR
jgi:hypothetical protein